MADEPMIMSCVPVFNGENLAHLRSLVGAEGAATIPWQKPYPGSIRGSCDMCGGSVWVGPKQQEYIARRPDAPVMCHPCAMVMTAAASGGVLHLHKLSNADSDFVKGHEPK